MPTCNALLTVLKAPEPSRADIDRMLHAAEALLRRAGL
jgi:hypothetical protein